MSTPVRGHIRKPRSVVWYYYEKVPSEPFKAQCKLCQVFIHHAMNTSNLFKHLKVKHPLSYQEANEQRRQELELYEQLKAKAGKPPSTSTRRPGRPKGQKQSSFLDGETSSNTSALAAVKAEPRTFTPASISTATRKSFGGTSASAAGKSRNITKALLRMLAKDMLPASILKGQGFIELLATCDVSFKMPEKKDVEKRMISDLAEETRNKVRADLKTASHLALTVEDWTYRGSRSFLTVTAHFLHDLWKMGSVVLETFDYTDEKSETNLATNLKHITDEWGLTDRVAVLVSNAPDNALSSASLINGWEELTCFGYTLNRMVNEAFVSVTELVRIKQKAVDAVSYFEVSVKAAETLAAVQLQHSLPVHRLKSERPGDWMSTFSMLTRVLEQYEAINTVLCFLNQDHMCLCDDEVEHIRGVVAVLRPFYAAAQELCTEPYTCISKLIPLASLLQQVTTSILDASAVSGPQVALRDSLLAQMQQNFSSLESSGTLAAATLLDPRFKQHAFTDSAALEAAQDRLLQDTQAVVQTISGSTPAKKANEAKDKEDSETSFWGIFDKKVVEAGAMKTDVSEADNEIRRFFKEVNIPRSGDPLQWWKLNEVQFPHLKVLARKFLCVPANAVPSSRLFSKASLEYVQRRELLMPGQLDNMIFLNQNLA